jgi:outer membrane protein TolC
LVGCQSAGKHRQKADQAAARIIEQKQMEALGRVEPFTIERPADALRRRLLIAQQLAYSGPASLGTENLEPIEHWPNDDYLSSPGRIADATTPEVSDQPLHLTLVDALQIAAHNSREYQSSKETVFRTALRLDRERDIFRNTFSGTVDGTFSDNESGKDTVRGGDSSFLGGLSRRFLNGLTLTARIGLDLARLLEPERRSSKSVYADSSISIPLLRGAGKHIVAEPLTQAEREVVYAIYDFEEYKRNFAVRVASSYLGVLRAADQINNAEENYRNAVTTARWTSRQADAGRKNYTVVEVGQAVQRELSARNSWVVSRQSYERSKDQFKMLLALPTDAKIELDRRELEGLAASSAYVAAVTEELPLDETAPPAEAPIVLQEPTREGAGPMELDEAVAIRLAFENRLDLRTAQGNVYDAQRAVVVAADRLRPELTLLGSASTGERRSMGSAGQPDSMTLDLDEGVYTSAFSVDLPLERTAEQISYRESLISLEQAVRNLQQLEDQIKLDVRDGLRALLQSRIGVRIEAQALELAKSRVEVSNLRLQAGRAIVRDLLESQEALLSAQNALTRAIVDYRIAELEVQRDLGVLQVNEQGLWKEYSPQEVQNEE